MERTILTIGSQKGYQYYSHMIQFGLKQQGTFTSLNYGRQKSLIYMNVL